jgi:hypothetical protein
MFRNRILIGSAFDDRLVPGLDPGGIKRVTKKEKNAAKRHIVEHKKYKNQLV